MSADNNSENKNLANSLTLAALGIVFGDIGTSPLYAFREAFAHQTNHITPEYILGVLSLIIWSLIVIVSVKYLVFVMKADNEGEGGILALTTLISKTSTSPSKKYLFTALGLFGSALLFGDGVLTPSISILSAVEGLKIAAPNLGDWVVPITIIILFLLFYFQSHGTQKIGLIFGPIIFLWFSSIAGFGVLRIIENTESLYAMNPMYGVELLIHHFKDGLIILSAVFLSVTGAEALYADMGHFGKTPIRRAWFFVAFPALALNYMGQASMILQNPETATNPFYLMIPEDFLYPMVALATLATVIASQALITGVYSITKQAIQLGYSPRVGIVHTSGHTMGQIYVPKINWILCVLTIWVVIEFKTSTALASAYGIAVSLTMFITTILVAIVAWYMWSWSALKALVFLLVFISVDIIFLGANLLKVQDGGWLPILLGILIFTVMMTWKQGRTMLIRKLKKKSVSIDEFIKYSKSMCPQHVRGTAFYLSGDPEKCPLALLHNLKHNKVLHDRVFLLNVKTCNIPVVPSDKKMEVEKLDDSFFKATALYGFMEKPDIRDIIASLNKADFDILISDVTFFLGRENLAVTKTKNWALWRKYLFSFLSQNSERANIYFNIPSDQVIEVGVQVDI